MRREAAPILMLSALLGLGCSNDVSGGPGGGGAGSATGGAGGSMSCGGQLCGSGQVCCGPPACGRCIPAMSGQYCPPTCDGSGGTAGAGGACAAAQAGCANGEQCCGGLTCCAGVPVPAGQEYCAATCPRSDRNLKTGIEAVDEDRVLERLASLPVSSWSYRSEGTEVRHLGPMAQDFKAAFGLGASDRTILEVDAHGVAFASIQAIHRRLEALEKENRRLRGRLHQLETSGSAVCREPGEGRND
jgi:hypothetical protein